MTTTLMPSPRQRFYDDAGKPLNGGKVYTFAAGSSAPKVAYQDAAGTVPHPNPIVLDAKGEATIYFVGNYKIDVRTRAGVSITGYPQDNFNSDPHGVLSYIASLATSAGSSLIGFIQAGVGAVLRTVMDKLRDTVSVRDFGADDSGAATATNVTAFQNAAALGRDVIVPKPLIAYYLASDPVIPANINIAASPEWFSGPGKLPMHAFVALSEGVDPRAFSIKSMNYSETAAGETKRKWGVVGWVNYKNPPSIVGTETDAVGVDGRGRTAVANGRVWGLLGLAQMDPGVSGVAQALGGEIDVNQNNANNTSFDGPLPAKGLLIASGGTYRPETSLFIIATKTPTNGLGDNRFYAGIRFYRDSCKEYLIHVDDENDAVFARIPSSSAGMHWIDPDTGAVFAEYQEQTNKRRIMWSQTPGHGYDWINSTGDRVLSTNDGNIECGKPLRRKSAVMATPSTLDATLADIFVLNSAGTVGDISGGADGQRITIINGSDGTITITVSESEKMRIAGTGVALTTGSTIELVFADPTWFQVGGSVN